MRGFSSIGLLAPKINANVGGALRAAACYGASSIIIQGARYHRNCADVTAAHRHIPLFHCDNLHDMIPFDAVPIAIEFDPGSVSLFEFQHPERAFYIFGPEDGSLGAKTTSWCKHKVFVPTKFCMNLAATVNVVLYDRAFKLSGAGGGVGAREQGFGTKGQRKGHSDGGIVGQINTSATSN